MTANALFGRFVGRESFVHALDPRMKLTLTAALFALVLCAFTPFALAVDATFIIIAYGVARITPKEVAATLWPLLVLVIMTALLNMVFVQGGTVYFQLGILVVSEEGLLAAAFLGCRLLLLLLVAALLTLTTSTFAITEALEAVMRPLTMVHVPVHELAMMMGIALRFLPQFVAELAIIRRAQLSRAAELSFNPFKGGLSTLAALIVPLFTSAFRHSETLAFAMDARCYHGGEGRTRLHPFAFTWRDGVALAVIGSMTVCLVLADMW